MFFYLPLPQEELKIANLAHSLLTEEEILKREKYLNYKLEKEKTLKVQFVWILLLGFVFVAVSPINEVVPRAA